MNTPVTVDMNKNGKADEDVQLYFNKLFQDGYLVNVHISIWGMGTQLSKADLKIEDNIPKIFKLGKKMLIDPKHLNEFKSIEGKARRYLYANSYPFPISEAHFIPKNNYPEVFLTLVKFKQEFMELTENFCANYATYRDEILNEYPDIADNLRPLYPSLEKIRSKFGFTISTFELSMPKELAHVDIQTILARKEAKEEVRKQLMDELKAQHEQSIEQIKKFGETAVLSLRQQIVETCEAIVDKIKRKEIISKANIKTIQHEIENFRALNFMDDKVVEAELDKLSRIIEGRRNFKTDTEAIEELNKAMSSVLTKARNISDIATLSNNYFRQIDL